MSDTSPRFTPRPRREPDEAARDRWPAVDEGLRGLLAECQAIVAAGRDTFDAPQSLTYRAGEAIVIHFHDVVSRRLPEGLLETALADLPLAAVTATRNILAHDYRAADSAIVWNVIRVSIPDAIRALLEAAARR